METKKRSTFYFDKSEKELLKEAANKAGFTTVNAFVRNVVLNRAKAIIKKG